MKALICTYASCWRPGRFAGDAAITESAAADSAGGTTHRYVIERTSPAGALNGLDAATKAKVNANNASVGVSWVKSFANADRTKTYWSTKGPARIRFARRRC